MIDLATLAAEPLLLAPTHAHSLAAALKREPEEYDHAKDVAAIYGVSPTDHEKPFAFANGVAFISVRGTLINRSTASYSWLTGYKGIVARVQAAAEDPQVTAVVYDVDSYGGEAAGCFEAAAFCRAALLAAGKPSMAMIDSNAYSGGYAIASGAGRISLTPSGGVGSTPSSCPIRTSRWWCSAAAIPGQTVWARRIGRKPRASCNWSSWLARRNTGGPPTCGPRTL